jgi:hypothetical protein
MVNNGIRRIGRITAASALVAGALGLAAFGAVGTAGADSILVSGNYATLEGCMADGPHVEVNVPGTWTHFSCDQHSDGLWYLSLYN